MRIIHFCAGLEDWNGMAVLARRFVAEELAAGHESRLTNRPEDIAGNIDAVHVHGAWLPAVHGAARRAKAIGAKLAVHPSGSYDPERLRYHGWKKRLMGPWERAMLRRADVLLATCPDEAAWIRAYCPGAAVELTDPKRFFDLGAETGSRRGREGKPLHVLYLGRRHPLKGVEYLERAVNELNRHSAIATPGDNPFDLRIESNVVGEAKERAWDWCDVLCLPTLSENFGIVVAEALERGKRVVTTDGAPAWAGLAPSRGTYLKGYRGGDGPTRVALLKSALTAARF